MYVRFLCTSANKIASNLMTLICILLKSKFSKVDGPKLKYIYYAVEPLHDLMHYLLIGIGKETKQNLLSEHHKILITSKPFSIPKTDKKSTLDLKSNI